MDDIKEIRFHLVNGSQVDVPLSDIDGLGLVGTADRYKRFVEMLESAVHGGAVAVRVYKGQHQGIIFLANVMRIQAIQS